MNTSQSIIAVLGLGLVAVCGSALADGAKGKIRICRVPLPGASTEPFHIPADGDFTGACHEDRDCREIVVGATGETILKGSAGTCATLDAVLLKSDGQPIASGEKLVPQWSTGPLVLQTTVVQPFK